MWHVACQYRTFTMPAASASAAIVQLYVQIWYIILLIIAILLLIILLLLAAVAQRRLGEPSRRSRRTKTPADPLGPTTGRVRKKPFVAVLSLGCLFQRFDIFVQDIEFNLGIMLDFDVKSENYIEILNSHIAQLKRQLLNERTVAHILKTKGRNQDQRLQ